MTIEKAKKNIFKNSDNLAFILGNGINRYYNSNNMSWNNLLLNTWNKVSDKKRKSIPIGISITEFYDALDLEYGVNSNPNQIQKLIKELMSKWQASPTKNHLLDRIKTLNAPIITTNFDRLIPQYFNLNKQNLDGSKFTDFYPWSTYYSDKKRSNPIDGFGVWYLNGMLDYHRSIKLGLSHYMGNVERARTLIHNKSPNVYHAQQRGSHWQGEDTWLHILFNKTLVIVGLGMNEVEVFVRWLLIERAKYLKRFPQLNHRGYFIDINNPQAPDSGGKELFLNAVGFELIRFDSFDDIYKNLWL